MPPSARTISTVASSMKLMQSHRMLPPSAVQQQRALGDGEGGRGADADQAGLVLAERVEMRAAQRRQRGPALAEQVHVLPLFLADRRSRAGATRPSGYCVPQVVQMKAGMRRCPCCPRQPSAGSKTQAAPAQHQREDHARLTRLNSTPVAEGRGVEREMVEHHTGDPAAERHAERAGKQHDRHAPACLGRDGNSSRTAST